MKCCFMDGGGFRREQGNFEVKKTLDATRSRVPLAFNLGKSTQFTF